MRHPHEQLVADLRSWKINFVSTGRRFEVRYQGREFRWTLRTSNREIRSIHTKIAELSGNQATARGTGRVGARNNHSAEIAKRKTKFEAQVAHVQEQLERPTPQQNLRAARRMAADYVIGNVSATDAWKRVHRMTTPQQREFIKAYEELTGEVISA